MVASVVRRDDVALNIDVRGDGAPVVLLPSLSRGAKDFVQLAEALDAGGFMAAAVNPRGIAGSSGPMEDLTMHHLADDVAAVVEHLGRGPAHLVGHAFGNRVARCLAADRGDLVRTVSLLAAGGKVRPKPENHWLPVKPTLDDDNFDGMRHAMFSPATTSDIAEAWRSGWWPDTLRPLAAATLNTPVDDWWSAGEAPILVVQGMDDLVAPPENAQFLADECGERVRVVEIADAGHAVLIEKPEEVARAVIAFLTLWELDP